MKPQKKSTATNTSLVHSFARSQQYINKAEGKPSQTMDIYKRET